MLDDIYRENIKLNSIRREISAMSSNIFHSRRKMRRLQAIEEAQRDILNTAITQTQSISSVVDKNNYRTYASQVGACYKMFNGESNYGAEFFRGILETRVAFISGEGLSVASNNKKTKEYIEKFLSKNKLQGSGLLQMNEVGELEGKVLIILKPSVKDQYIKTNIFSWYENTYDVQTKDGEFQKAIYSEKDGSEEKTISNEYSVYIKLGGTWLNQNNTPSKIHCVLTEIENASRAKFDSRKNAHYFGRVTPTWKTDSQNEANAIKKDVNSGDWQIGRGYAGTGAFGLVEPSGRAADMLEKDLLLNLRTISATLGIPIHWLAWPDLMSNRATAENMLEMIAAGTRKERLLYEEAFKEIIQKSMIMAIDAGFETNDILDDFEVKLPLISITMVKQLSETWLPLQQNDVIGMGELRNRIPGIDPLAQEKMIEDEKEKNMQRMSDVIGQEINRRQHEDENPGNA